MNFKEFFCERVYRLSNKEQESISTLVDKYMDFFNPQRVKMPLSKILALGFERVYQSVINSKGFIKLGYVSFYDDMTRADNKIPVFVSSKKVSEDKGEYVYQIDDKGQKSKESIILYFYKIKYNRDFVEDTLVHELNHAKQPYKTPGKHYRRSVLDYYIDPVEVHNYVSNIVKAIENEYLRRARAGRSIILEFLKRFMEEGKLPDMEESTIIKNIGKDEFVDYLYKNRDNPKVAKEYKRFLAKLAWLYSNLSAYENR